MSSFSNPFSNAILNSIAGGEFSGSIDMCRIGQNMEDHFLKAHEYYDYPLPASVLSTIAIAISHDGNLVATTHGDHTVKVFWYTTGKPCRIFRGHPRTPWTVKFHTTDSNIVASGCLGFEVRVWDIKLNACISIVRYDYSIISLAFHPEGDVIGVATGPQLHMWKWKNNAIPPYKGLYRPNPECPAAGRQLCVLNHSRNIRAVLFHPQGKYIITAAPDSPRQQMPQFTPCRLYAFTFDDIKHDPWDEQAGETGENDGDNPQSSVAAPTQHMLLPAPPLELADMPVLIPQVHLYSDGGIDISADGNYLFTCARLLKSNQPFGAFPKIPSCPPSPNSPTEAHDAGGAAFLPLHVPRLLSVQQRDRRVQIKATAATYSLQYDVDDFPGGPIVFYNPRLHDSLSGYKHLKSATFSMTYTFADPRDESIERDLPTWIPEDHLCLFKLVQDRHTNLRTSLVRSQRLAGSLVKAVTSTKLSPTGRYALIGYGVRSEGAVEDHANSHVACEIVSLSDMSTVTVMPDDEDEVNIAQFHPISGMGILYGTKKGKVRTFRKKRLEVSDDLNIG